MTDPTRWLAEEDAPESARRLLQAIEIPRPPSATRQAELVHELETLASGLSLARDAALGGAWMKQALVGGGAAGSVALLLAALQIFSGAPDSAANEETPLAAIESASSLVAAPLPPPAEPRADATPVAASNDTARPRVASSLPAPSVPRSRPDALAVEEALLERARGLASGAPARAWELLERHRRRFPSGQLVAERLFLSVDVLQRLGKTQAANARAETLMLRFPDSVYAAQLRKRDGRDQAAHP